MMKQYHDFDARELFCPHCKRSTPVKKKLLLILPGGDKYHYTCQICGTSVGEKTVVAPDNYRLKLR